jgi:hypothetical protein
MRNFSCGFSLEVVIPFKNVVWFLKAKKAGIAVSPPGGGTQPGTVPREGLVSTFGTES